MILENLEYFDTVEFDFRNFKLKRKAYHKKMLNSQPNQIRSPVMVSWQKLKKILNIKKRKFLRWALKSYELMQKRKRVLKNSPTAFLELEMVLWPQSSLKAYKIINNLSYKRY